MNDDYKKIANDLIDDFEMFIRSFIKKSLSEEYGDWTKGIPNKTTEKGKGILDKWEQKRNSGLQKDPNMNKDLMIQADFSDYSHIIFNNWNIYREIFNDINKQRVRVDLERLTDFRNKIKHNKGTIEGDELYHHSFIIKWFKKMISQKYQEPVNQAEIHRMVYSENEETQRKAADLLGEKFDVLFDKEQAWEDLKWLLLDEDIGFRAVYALGEAFPYIPDKKQAWEELHMKAQYGEDVDLISVASVIGLVFPHIPDQSQAWEDLIKLTHDSDIKTRHNAIVSLGIAFFYLSDKTQPWEDIFLIIKEKSDGVWSRAWIILYHAFPHIPNKEQGWEDIHKLTIEDDKDFRLVAIKLIGEVYPYIPKKEQADADLQKLREDDNMEVQMCAREIGDRIEISSKMMESLSKVSEELT